MHMSYVCVQIYIIECTHRQGNFHEANIAERFRLVRCRMVSLCCMESSRLHDQGLARLGLATLALGTTKSGSEGVLSKRNQRIRMNQTK